MKLKEGDKVILTTDIYTDTKSNPLYGGKHGKVVGTIYNIVNLTSLPKIGVEWSNGHRNGYDEIDLNLYVPKTADEFNRDNFKNI